MWRAVNPAESARFTSAPCRSTSAFICKKATFGVSRFEKATFRVRKFEKATFRVSSCETCAIRRQRVSARLTSAPCRSTRASICKRATFRVSRFEMATFHVSSCETCAIRRQRVSARCRSTSNFICKKATLCVSSIEKWPSGVSRFEKRLLTSAVVTHLRFGVSKLSVGLTFAPYLSM